MEQAVKVTDVNTEDIELLWPRVEPFLQGALEHSQGEYSLEDIKLQLMTGLMRLWIAYDEEGIILASAVSEIRIFPQKRVCFVILMGGENMERWLHTSAAVQHWAMENGADSVVGYVRKGLAKKLKDFGYREIYTVVQQDLVNRRLH